MAHGMASGDRKLKGVPSREMNVVLLFIVMVSVVVGATLWKSHRRGNVEPYDPRDYRDKPESPSGPASPSSMGPV